MAFFLNHLELLFGGAMFCIALFTLFLWKVSEYGKEKESLKVAEANLEASKSAKETAEAIINGSDAAGVDKLRKLQQDKRD